MVAGRRVPSLYSTAAVLPAHLDISFRTGILPGPGQVATGLFYAKKGTSTGTFFALPVLHLKGQVNFLHDCSKNVVPVSFL